ncbi:hypothetical protein [Yersinia wautersii]|nr:hypothetical protein [Yersinia wautersii]
MFSPISESAIFYFGEGGVMVTETVPVVGSDQLLPRAQGWFAAYWSVFH